MIDIVLPDQEYVHFEDGGKQITVCTLRQKVLHTIGLIDTLGEFGQIFRRFGIL